MAFLGVLFECCSGIVRMLFAKQAILRTTPEQRCNKTKGGNKYNLPFEGCEMTLNFNKFPCLGISVTIFKLFVD